MVYKRSDYGPNPHAGKQRNNAQARGWGTGWPDCQWSRFVKVTRGGVSISVRREIAELVATLLTVTEQRGYDVLAAGDGRCGGTWGVACRAIRGTNWPSNHSWGLAVDVNAPCNPMGSRFVTDIPPEVVEVWETCGFYWGGRYTNRPDAMHFEYIFRPMNVPKHTEKARSFLTGGGGGSPGGGGGGGGDNGKLPEYKPGSRVNSSGQTGTDVQVLQRFLGSRRAGPDDGIYGPRTERGVRAYQRMRGLAVDGIAGPRTWAPILRVLGRGRRTRPTIKRGSRGTHVKALQRHLKAVYPLYAKHLDVDGIFGPQTERAVREFQRRSKIKVDGIVGSITWRKLGI